MKKKTRQIAFGGILTALSVAVLWIGSTLPGYEIAVAAMAGLIPAAAVVRGGVGDGLAVYGASSLLALVLLPHKIPALWYLVIFGYYGAVKSLAERAPGRILEWIIKVLTYTLAFFVLYLLLHDAFAALTDLIPLGILPVYWIGLVVFCVYDIGFSRLIGLYLRRIDRNLGKGA